jgi:hypothetical protein
MVMVVACAACRVGGEIHVIHWIGVSDVGLKIVDDDAAYADGAGAGMVAGWLHGFSAFREHSGGREALGIELAEVEGDSVGGLEGWGFIGAADVDGL